jgi:hypothetical protein
MKDRLFYCFLVLLIIISCTTYAQSTYNWRGNLSSDWSVAGNWRIGGTTATTPPGTLDNVQIGISTTTFTNQPTINAGYTPTVASVTFGGVKVVNLIVNGVLTVNGDLVQRHSDAGLNLNPTISGSGTINCVNLGVGSNVAPPLPFLGLTTQTYTTLLSSSVARLNLSNNLNLNTTSSTATLLFIVNYNVNNPYFYLQGGDMTIGNSIATTNSNYVSAGATVNLAEFYIMANTAACTLTFNGATPLAFDPNGAGGVDFYNAGPFSSTVIYNYNGAATQTVYSNGQSRFGVSPASYQYIQFANAGAKSIQSGNLTVGADWTSTGGKIDAVTNNTTVTFQGTTQSLTDGGSDGGIGVTFKNATFTGGGTKTLTSGKFNIATTGVLTMASNSTLNANGNLTLFSNAASSAAVAIIPSGSSITNNVNVQRYLTGGNTKVSGVYTARGYRMLSSPVNYNNTAYLPLSYIGNSALTGGPGTGFTVTINNPTIYLYREDITPSNTTFNSGKHKGILNIKSGNIVTVSGSGDLQVPVGNGYIFYFVGNTSNPTTKTVPPFTAGPENTVITATGRLNQGDVPVNLWYTPAGATGTTTNKLSYQASLVTLAGYNMVGNPYASTLDLDDVINDNTASIGNTVYELYNVNPSQKYIAYNKGGSSDPNATRYVVSGQGFIVKAKGINGSLTFHESQKEPTEQVTGLNLLMGMPVAENVITGFYIKIERDSVVNDYCGIYFNSNASANYDDDDAQDLDGASNQVYMSSFSADGVRTAINHLPDYKNGAEIKLYVNSAATGLYKLKIEDIRNISPLYDIWLKDNFIKDSLNLRLYNAYNFNISKTDTSSFGANRFKLVIRRQQLPAYELVKLTAQKVTEGVKISWKTYNEGNYTGFELEKLNGQYTSIYNVQSNGNNTYSYLDRSPLAGTNTYRLKQNDINNAISYSNPVTLQLQDPSSDQLLQVYPNPAVQKIKVYINNAVPQTSYKAKIYDYSGKLVIQSTMSNGNAEQNVGQLQPGSYIFELSKSNGDFVGRTKFIKKL